MVPRPMTGGGGTVKTKASWMAANCWFSAAAMAGPLRFVRLALLERLQTEEDDAGVGRDAEAADAQPGEGHRALHAGLFAGRCPTCGG